MKLKLVILDFELSPRVKKLLVSVGVPSANPGSGNRRVRKRAKRVQVGRSVVRRGPECRLRVSRRGHRQAPDRRDDAPDEHRRAAIRQYRTSGQRRHASNERHRASGQLPRLPASEPGCGSGTRPPTSSYRAACRSPSRTWRRGSTRSRGTRPTSRTASLPSSPRTLRKTRST